MGARRSVRRLDALRLFLEIAFDGGQGRLAGSRILDSQSAPPVLPVRARVHHFHRQVLGPDLPVAGTVAGDRVPGSPGKDAPERPAAEGAGRLDALILDAA